MKIYFASPNGLFLVAISSLFIIITNIALQIVLERNAKISGSCKNCNVVIIDIDILRADALDCDEFRNRTPNICSFFDNAVYFKDNISHSDNTRPSFISGMTSLYPRSHTIEGAPWDEELNSQVVTLPGVLQKKGYETILVTHKWGGFVLNTDWFDQVVNTNVLPEKLKELAGKDEPFLVYTYNVDLHFPHLLYDQNDIDVDMEKVSKGIPKSNDEWVEIQKNYIIKNYQKVFKTEAIKNHPELFQGDLEKNKSEIFSLFNSYSGDRELYRLLHDEWIIRYNSILEFINPNNPEDIAYFKSRYLSGLKIVDSTLADIFQLLSSSELKRNTIVVLRSDHGEEFYEHGQFAHQNNLYQETIRTPLILKFPKSTSTNIHFLTQDIDVMPTLLDILNIEIPVQAQGKSLIPMIENSNYSIRDYQIAQKAGDWLATYRKNQWKIIIINSKLSELYDLETDPGEKINLFDINDNYSQIGKTLFQEYNQIKENQVVYPNPNTPLPPWIDEEKQERLKQEGYF